MGKKTTHDVPRDVYNRVGFPVKARVFASPSAQLSGVTTSFYLLPNRAGRVQLTDWFDGSKVFPAHPGIYLTRFRSESLDRYMVGWSYFDGESWGGSWNTMAKAEEDQARGKNITGLFPRQDKDFRGLYRELFTHEKARINSTFSRPASKTIHSIEGIWGKHDANMARAAAHVQKSVSDVIQGAADALRSDKAAGLGGVVAKLVGKRTQASEPKKPYHKKKVTPLYTGLPGEFGNKDDNKA